MLSEPVCTYWMKKINCQMKEKCNNITAGRELDLNCSISAFLILNLQS
jgi:hypothetical protein